jgi:hypothetical protein
MNKTKLTISLLLLMTISGEHAFVFAEKIPSALLPSISNIDTSWNFTKNSKGELGVYMSSSFREKKKFHTAYDMIECGRLDVYEQLLLEHPEVITKDFLLPIFLNLLEHPKAITNEKLTFIEQAIKVTLDIATREFGFLYANTLVNSDSWDRGSLLYILASINFHDMGLIDREFLYFTSSDIATLLIENGANPSYRYPMNYYRGVLTRAIISGNYRLCDILNRQDATLVYQKDGNGNTAEHWLFANKNDENRPSFPYFLGIVLNENFDAFRENNNEQHLTPIFLAVLNLYNNWFIETVIHDNSDRLKDVIAYYENEKCDLLCATAFNDNLEMAQKLMEKYGFTFTEDSPVYRVAKAKNNRVYDYLKSLLKDNKR